MALALDRIAEPVRYALQTAASSIRSYHQAQVRPDIEFQNRGITVRGLHQPVRRAGCYVPGGRAVYPSTVLMTAIPAAVAGVSEIAVCVPPAPDGRIPEVVLAAASIAGVHEVFAVGGAQAIAALAYGTETISPVDVIVGPGNVYVALAKREVYGQVAVPSAFAGPSEIVVVGDGSAPASYAAIDLIVQAEHGPDGLAWFITWDESVADEVSSAVRQLVLEAPRRAEIEATLNGSGIMALCRDCEQAMKVANFIAPEHLELQTADPEELLPLVRNAGAVFCGSLTPASLGDYIAGPSHVLPTAGTARFAGALTVHDFIKDTHVISATQLALSQLGPHVITLADTEGLDAHAGSIRLRVEQRYGDRCESQPAAASRMHSGDTTLKRGSAGL